MNLFFTNIAIAYAEDGVDAFLGKVSEQILNPVIVLLFVVAFIYFLWGVSQMILNAESDEGQTLGKSHMLWGIIGMTIMFSVWGIMNLIVGTLKTTTGIGGTIDPQSGKVQLNNYKSSLPSVGNGGGTNTPILPPVTTDPNNPVNLPEDTSSNGNGQIILSH